MAEFLGQEGFTVTAVHEGTAGVERALSGEFLLIVLDVMLPGMSGFDVLRRIREHSDVPVIMLTARGEDVDRIVGLEIGADDYMPKPFNPRELTARMRAVLRRVDGGSVSAETGPRPLAVGDLSLDLGARVVRRGHEAVTLTGIEFAVLEILIRSAGQVVGRDELSRSALGRRASTIDRSLDVHVSNLRKKLGPLPNDMERIKTVRGVGYQYVLPAVDPGA